MAVSYESVQTATGDNASTLTITKPTGLASGDLMVAMLGKAETEADWTASGWTSLGGLGDANFQGATDGNITCLAKIADEVHTPPAPYNDLGDMPQEEVRKFIASFYDLP